MESEDVVAVVIIFLSFVITVFCASLTPCSFRFSTMSCMGVNLTLLHCMTPLIIIIIILSFDIAPFPYKHAQRRITFHCQRIDVDIHIVN